jgi:hypothetical protein
MRQVRRPQRGRTTCEIKINIAVAGCLWALVALVALVFSAARTPPIAPTAINRSFQLRCTAQTAKPHYRKAAPFSQSSLPRLSLDRPRRACRSSDMATLYSSPRLRDWPLPMVRLACDQCGRRGQYRHERLLAEYDPGEPMPDLRHLLAQCPRRNAPGMSCGVYYADLMRRP